MPPQRARRPAVTGRRRIPLVARSRSGRPIGSARGWGGLMGDQSSGRGRGVDVVSRSERTGGASGRLRLRRRAPRGLWWLPSYRPMRPDLEGTAVSGWLTRSARKPRGSLVHFGAVVADAPSPLSTPRSAAGQAQLRLGKPLRMKCRASPVLLFMRTGKVVAGSVGIVRAND